MANLRSPFIPDLSWGGVVSSWALLLWKTLIQPICLIQSSKAEGTA